MNRQASCSCAAGELRRCAFIYSGFWNYKVNHLFVIITDFLLSFTLCAFFITKNLKNSNSSHNKQDEGAKLIFMVNSLSVSDENGSSEHSSTQNYMQYH